MQSAYFTDPVYNVGVNVCVYNQIMSFKTKYLKITLSFKSMFDKWENRIKLDYTFEYIYIYIYIYINKKKTATKEKTHTEYWKNILIYALERHSV